MTPEELMQIALFEWAELAKAQYPELLYMYHVPNGGHRHKFTAAKLKRMGVRRGVPDVCLPVARGGYHGLYVELKCGKNKTTPEQKEFLRHLAKNGYFIDVVRDDWEEAKHCIVNYLQGVYSKENSE